VDQVVVVIEPWLSLDTRRSAKKSKVERLGRSCTRAMDYVGSKATLGRSRPINSDKTGIGTEAEALSSAGETME
jgi:hypothetical protein